MPALRWTEDALSFIYTWAAGKAAWLAIIGALLACLMFQQVRVSNARAGADRARAELADTKTRYAQAAQKAEADARAEEARRTEATRKVVSDAQSQTAAAQAAALDAGRAADGLRVRLAQYLASVRQAPGNPGTAGSSAGEQSSDPLDVLSGVLSRMGDDAGRVAAYADRLRVAGSACERAYDSLQPAAR
jgi:hypothetical protein